MEQESVRKPYTLTPTPSQERELERVRGLCRALYNMAMEQRKIAYERCGVSLLRYGQEAELKDICAEISGVRDRSQPHLARRTRATRQSLTGILSSHPRRTEARLSPLSWPSPLQPFHLHTI
jgi:hypothetical protein